MDVPQNVLRHKTLMIALIDTASRICLELGLSADAGISAMCQTIGANRTSVYQQIDRLINSLSDLAGARAGRPVSAEISDDPCQCAESALTIRVLEFRLAHFDAVFGHPKRTSYSPSFRRFILEELDRWDGTTASFADAAQIPGDTLKDWVRDDRAGIEKSRPPKPPVEVPVDASETTRSIVQDFEGWEGPTKDFLRIAGCRYGLSSNQVAKVLRIVGAIAPRSKRGFRHRGTTEELSPGSFLVTDGKTLDIELTGSGRRTRKNWQGIVDQATGCDTAAVVTQEEGADAGRQAFDESVQFLGGVAPCGLLHDNKPCYQDAMFRDHLASHGTVLVAATLERPENKALLEGAFSLFETRVGTIRLDDTNHETLIHSAVGEIVRAYAAATNGVPREKLEGLSRQVALREARPSEQQQDADRAFIRDLKERHERQKESRWREKIKPISLQLLHRVFLSLGLLANDPHGKLQEFLSIYEPAAIRQAATVVSAVQARGDLNSGCAHRYLAKVIQNKQEMLDLERASIELRELCRQQRQDWVEMERMESEELERNGDPETLVRAFAERAAFGGVPLQGAFWTEKLLCLLQDARHLAEPVKRFLIRLYGAPPERRLHIIDTITAIEFGVS